MIEKLMKLITKLHAENQKIHEKDGKTSGFTCYDVQSFAPIPEIKSLLKGNKLGWVCISTDRHTVTNTGSPMPPHCYIGQAKGGTLDDVANALAGLDF